jgi:hypothetical protein
MTSCFYCDHERVEWALDRLGDLLDAEVPPEWILGKMTEVISLLHHPVDDLSSAPAETDYSTESPASTPEG